MILIDGSRGEGGGQMLRTALSLSAVTGIPFKIERIRKQRKRPGLLAQHLACVHAAAKVCNAEISGDFKGSETLVFQPGIVRHGSFECSVGTSGSALLVFQTLFPALSFAGEASLVRISGGTHNPMAPSFDFIEKVFLPAAAEAGFFAELTLMRHGFHPRGGGVVEGRILPRREGMVLRMLERGGLKEMRPRVLLADLDWEIGQREARVLGRAIKRSSLPVKVKRVPQGAGPGNAVLIEARYGSAKSVFSAIGTKGIRAEAVARDAVEGWLAFHKSEVPVQKELADQLLLPIALAGQGSFRTGPLTEHFLTNLAVIRDFLDVGFDIEEEGKGRFRVTCRPASEESRKEHEKM